MSIWLFVLAVCALILGIMSGGALLLRVMGRNGWRLHDAHCTVCRKKIRTAPFPTALVHSDTFDPDCQCSAACRKAREDLPQDLIREQQRLIGLFEREVATKDELLASCEIQLLKQQEMIDLYKKKIDMLTEDATLVWNAPQPSACPFCSSQGPFRVYCSKCGQVNLPE